jgi:hypothetical protein
VRVSSAPCGGDLLDAEQVTVGQRAAWLPGMDRMVVAGAEDQVPALAWVPSAMRTAGPAATTPRRIMTDLGQAWQFGQTMTWLREVRCVRAAAPIAAMGTPLGRGGCMCGADGYLLAKLVSSYSCPLASGSWRRPWRWPGKLAPGRQSACGINAGAGRGAVFLHCPAGRGAIAMDAG